MLRSTAAVLVLCLALVVAGVAVGDPLDAGGTASQQATDPPQFDLFTLEEEYSEGETISIYVDVDSANGGVTSVNTTQVDGTQAEKLRDVPPDGFEPSLVAQFVAPDEVEGPDDPDVALTERLTFRVNVTDGVGNTGSEEITVNVDSANPETPTVSFADQTTTGESVVVESIESYQDAFVAIYDESPATAGPENVVGVAPAEEDGPTTVDLFDVPGRTFDRENLTESGTLWAVLHVDLYEDDQFDYLTSNRQLDQQFTDENGAVIADSATVTVVEPEPEPNATIDFRDQTLFQIEEDFVTVDSTTLRDGGFLALYADNGTLVATSDLLPSGTTDDVAFPVTELPASQNATVVAYRDTDGDGTADPAPTVSDLTAGDDDPYREAGEPVAETAFVQVGEPPNIDAFVAEELYTEGDDIDIFVDILDRSGEIVDVTTTQIAGPQATKVADEPADDRTEYGAQFVAPELTEGAEEFLTFRVTMTDEYGNVGTAEITVAVQDTPEPSPPEVGFPDQRTNGETVVVDAINRSTPAFVAIYDEPPATAGPENVIGVAHADGAETTVDLFDVPGRTFDREELTEGQRLWAVLHADDPQDGEFRFVTSGGSEDQPLTNETGAVVADAADVGPVMTYYQLDLLGGEPYERLGPHADNGFYGDETESEDRLLRFAHGTDVDGLTDHGTATPQDELRECVLADRFELGPDGETASATFTVAEGCDDVELTFAAYEKSGPGFSRSMNQTLADAETDSYGPGTYTVTVELPEGVADGGEGDGE
ncbi:DUF7282 domain-containing protein [Salinirubrum litoreum]|uniref:DUF7282 domain-containing protein n=1 Tax=Salinirubrum litoreum TaxID=1126234 RepID=A0ABD5RDD6_9EURY|nr:hypothetical protein [Salinirubrum litoreum]